MAQHDMIIDNGPGLAVRTDINAALNAVVTNYSGPTEPTVKYAGQWWLDTSAGTNGTMKLRNQANSAWVTLLGDFVLKTGDTMSGDLIITKVNSVLALNIPAAGSGRAIYGQTNGSLRWVLAMGNGSAESGAGAGSDFGIARYTDAGALIDNPIIITRSTGNIDIAKQLRFADAGGVIRYFIQGGSTSVNFATNIGGTTGVYLAPGGSAWVAFSDERLDYKSTATPVGDVLARLGGVQLYSGASADGVVEVFFMAQELAETLPELVVEPTGPEAENAEYVPVELGDPNAWGVMYDRSGAVALQAVKELLARVEELTARVESLEVGLE